MYIFFVDEGEGIYTTCLGFVNFIDKVFRFSGRFFFGLPLLFENGEIIGPSVAHTMLSSYTFKFSVFNGAINKTHVRKFKLYIGGGEHQQFWRV